MKNENFRKGKYPRASPINFKIGNLKNGLKNLELAIRHIGRHQKKRQTPTKNPKLSEKIENNVLTLRGACFCVSVEPEKKR